MLTTKASWGIVSGDESTYSKDTVNPTARLEAEFLGLICYMPKRVTDDPEDIVREEIRR